MGIVGSGLLSDIEFFSLVGCYTDDTLWPQQFPRLLGRTGIVSQVDPRCFHTECYIDTSIENKEWRWRKPLTMSLELLGDLEEASAVATGFAQLNPIHFIGDEIAKPSKARSLMERTIAHQTENGSFDETQKLAMPSSGLDALA